jgi:hypothetical protein
VATERWAFLDVDREEYRYSAEIAGAHHFDVRHRDANLARLHDLVIAGDRVLLFSWCPVRHHPGIVVSVVARALRSPGLDGSCGGVTVRRTEHQ